MATFHVEPVQAASGASQKIDASVTVPIVAQNGTQLWMVCGTGKWVQYGATSGAIKAAVTVTLGDDTVQGGTLSIWTNHPPNHCAFPPLFFTTTLGSGQATVSIVGDNDFSQWDSNDTLQVTVVEMDHTGLGGGA